MLKNALSSFHAHATPPMPTLDTVPALATPVTASSTLAGAAGMRERTPAGAFTRGAEPAGSALHGLDPAMEHLREPSGVLGWAGEEVRLQLLGDSDRDSCRQEKGNTAG